MKYCVGVGKNRQCECIIGGRTIDGHVDNVSDYPVIDWLNQLNKLVVEGEKKELDLDMKLVKS